MLSPLSSEPILVQCSHSFSRSWQLLFLNQQKGEKDYSKTCVRQPPLKLTLVVDVEWWLSYKGTCHVILLAKLHDMYLYKTDNFFHINHYLKSVSKVALLHRFYCIENIIGREKMIGWKIFHDFFFLLPAGHPRALKRWRSFVTISGRSFSPNFGFPYTFYTFSLFSQLKIGRSQPA